MARSPEQHTRTFAAVCARRRVVRKRHTTGERKGRHQGFELAARSQRIALRQPGHRQQGPRHVGLHDLHGRVLEFRLAGARAIGRSGQCIHASQALALAGHAAQILFAPVHGHESLAHRHFGRSLQGHHDRAAPGSHLHQIALFEQAPRHVLRVHLQHGLSHVTKQPAQRASAAHAVPLVAQAAGGQGKRKARLACLGHGLIDRVDEARLAVRGGKHAVFIQARLPARLSFLQGPLLRRGLEHGVTHAGDVQVAPARRFAVFVPDGFNAGRRVGQRIGEQARGRVGWPGRQALFKPLREVQGDGPVVPAFARCCNGRAHPADAAFAVGHRAGFLAPGGGGEQQVGEVAAGCRGKSFLHHHELGALERAAHGGLVGHGLRRVRAGDPQRLDLAIGRRLEHFHRRLAGLFGHGVHAPQGRDFGPVLRVGQVAVRAQQVGQAADFAPAHGVGLTGQ